MPSAEEFKKSFFRAYKHAVAEADEGTWKLPHAWSNFMIWRDEAVLKKTALNLNLQWYKGEPLHFDGVLVTPGVERWFPMRVVIEHENDPGSFVQEIRKLLCVRAPLKVGITYVYYSEHAEKDLAQIKTHIDEEFEDARNLISEDERAEYLFLVGFEATAPNEPQWRSIAFTAGEGPRGVAFDFGEKFDEA
jgi:hypothetical protein